MKKTSSQTKIIATLGPSTSSKEIMQRLIEEGVDVFRLNFSHSTQAEHLKLIHSIRQLNQELNTNVAILADLQGPKLRIGEIENNRIDLEKGDVVNFVSQKCIGTKKAIYMSYREFSRDVNPGELMLIDDGKIELEVVETNKKDLVKARVIYGGPLSSRKGVNLPNTKISLPSLTKEDISNAVFAMENDVDWIALSFVRKASDIEDLKKLIEKHGGHAGVIAKIEKPEALDEIDKIIDITDAVMVARGDLGVEVSFDKVPLIQKKIVEKCIKQAKPVIIATQMMESMINNFTPTRAEANDVANAVLEGADALMLSGETSIGKYPVETILNMQKIIDFTEKQGKPFNKKHQLNQNSSDYYADAICYNATVLSKQTKANSIIAITHSGYTANRLASHRPEADIFTFTNNDKLLKKLSLVWGVRTFYLPNYERIEEVYYESIKRLKTEKMVKEGDTLVHVASIPLKLRGSTNMIKITRL